MSDTYIVIVIGLSDFGTYFTNEYICIIAVKF